MAVEVCSYRLSLRGTAVGMHVLRTEHRGQTTLLEGRLALQGSLGQVVTTQTSRVHRRRFYSLSFREDTQRRGENRIYDVTFDTQAGLVRASRGPNDEAVVPYVQRYRDPLGLLFELRELGEFEGVVRVPMLGKEVAVSYLGNVTLETLLGERNAYAYQLHPGMSYVYVDAEGDHQILQMTQRFEGGLLDANLVKVDQEEAMPERAPERSSGPGKRRRRKRRRRR